MNTRNMLGYAGPSPQQIGQALMQPAGSTQDVNAMLSQVPVQKGNVFPLTTYGDNSTRFDPSAGITGALIQALTAPSRAYKGEMSREDMVPEALNVAGMAMGGGAFAPLPRNALGANRFTLDYFGQPVKVVGNATPKETAGFLSRTKYKAARRIVDPDTGDTYIWDAADPALHQLVAEQLGIDPKKMTADMIGLD